MVIPLLLLALHDGSDLAARLGHEDPEVREKATAEAIALGRPALKPLRILMDSDDPEVAGRAEQAFKSITESLKAGAVKLEITLESAKVRKGVVPAFTARLVNVEEFPVEVFRPQWTDEDAPVSAKKVQRAAAWRDFLSWKPMTLQPGESVDVTEWTRPVAWPSTAGKQRVSFQMQTGRPPSAKELATPAARELRTAEVEIEIVEE